MSGLPHGISSFIRGLKINSINFSDLNNPMHIPRINIFYRLAENGKVFISILIFKELRYKC